MRGGWLKTFAQYCIFFHFLIIYFFVLFFMVLLKMYAMLISQSVIYLISLKKKNNRGWTLTIPASPRQEL